MVEGSLHWNPPCSNYPARGDSAFVPSPGCATLASAVSEYGSVLVSLCSLSAIAYACERSHSIHFLPCLPLTSAILPPPPALIPLPLSPCLPVAPGPGLWSSSRSSLLSPSPALHSPLSALPPTTIRRVQSDHEQMPS